LGKTGDVLRYEEVADLYSAEKASAEVQRFQGAWARRLSEYPCPFKYEDGKKLIRQDDGSWQPEQFEDPAYLWSDVEDDAFGRDPGYDDHRVIPASPTINAVVFIESKGGRRHTKPLDANTDLPGAEAGAASALADPVTNDDSTCSATSLAPSRVRNEAAERTEE
jgi:hypothetical protein